jgi:hypothetical protein
MRHSISSMAVLSMAMIWCIVACGGADGEPSSHSIGDTGGNGGTDASVVSPFAGNWTGTWGDGTYGLSFVMTDSGNITALRISHSARTCVTGDLEIQYDQPIAVASDNSFSQAIDISDVQDGWSVTINDAISGAFAGDSVTGTYTAYDLITAASTCLELTGSSTYAMEARKDCSLKPKKGVSATRFCP